MSLAIDREAVTAVLLADGWHQCVPESFDLDAFEFVDYSEPSTSGVGFAARTIHSGGKSGICATGFVFQEAGEEGTVAGPLSAVLAVRVKPS